MNLINYIKARKLSWFGHLNWMSEKRIYKKVYKLKLMLTKLLGRPKNRWGNDIRNDMKKLTIKNWTSCIQDRNNWTFYVEKDKTFNGWSCSAYRTTRRRKQQKFVTNSNFPRSQTHTIFVTSKFSYYFLKYVHISFPLHFSTLNH